MSISGVHALITGGGSGIGAAVAEALDALGCSLTLVGRNRERLEGQAARWPGAVAAVADVTDEASLQAAFAQGRARHGDPAILINNAGVAFSAPILKTTRADFDRILATNLTGAFLCSKLALPWMLECGFGRIVNVASVAGLKAYPYTAAYVASKHGLIGLTRAMALDVATRGVTVNAVCPAFTETAIVQDAVGVIVEKTGRTAEQARAELTRHNPQGRLVTPAEVASAVAMLCARESAAINGVALPIAGGEV